MKFYWVCFMANARNTLLYVGVTNDITRRVNEHKEHKEPKSFTARYNADKQVWFEAHLSIKVAINREMQLKGRKREWKDALISETNPERTDLSGTGFYV